jgi:hypothetical protein
MKKYDVAAYIWPAYHYEPLLEHIWPEKDGEWYTVRRGKPRFQGHEMPKIPLLGYQNEADPEVMRQHVKLGKDYCVNTFIMDWYWYDNGPCFERQLNEGLIPALEGSDSKFYLMWANHDADTLWDMHTDERKLIWDGKVRRKVFENMMERVIDKYFKLDNYYLIDGKPVFSIFSPANLLVGLGGVSETGAALDWLRNRVKEKGLPGIHLQFIVRRGNNDGPEAGAEIKNISYDELAARLGVDSGTSYQYVADAGCADGDYVAWANAAIAKWEHDEKVYPMFFPHVSVGWDNTQRNPSVKTAVVNNNPSAFEACLRKAKNYIDSHPGQPGLITINSWNEWTEGSYLLPDRRRGYAYLEAVKKVFGP